MSVKGIDVASFQGTAPDTKGLAFLFTKATQGTGYVNPKMNAQAAHARKNGLVLGFYHFLVTGNVQKQAEYFVAKAASQPGDILACDWETDPSTGHHPTNAEKDAFIKAVKKLRPDHQVVLYCNLTSWKTLDHTGYYGDGLWIADPSAPAGAPRVKSSWVFHQYGIKGTDLDVANFATAAALRTWSRARIDEPETEPGKPAPGKPSTPPAKPPTKPKPAPPFPGEHYFGPGKTSAHVTTLGKQLVKKGYGRFYSKGPGPKWTDSDRNATRAFQLAHASLKGDPDGLPGPKTWKLLFS